MCDIVLCKASLVPPFVHELVGPLLFEMWCHKELVYIPKMWRRVSVLAGAVVVAGQMAEMAEMAEVEVQPELVEMAVHGAELQRPRLKPLKVEIWR